MVTILAVLAAVIVGLSVFSRAAVFVIDRMWPPNGRFLEIDGLRLHVIDLPAASTAPSLLLIHGASGNLREPVAALRDALGGRFRLIGIDRPGHGHSSRGSRETSDPARQADLVAAALDALGAGPCLVLGHSWGAAVAALLAARHPDHVSGLVLVAPATHPWPGGVSRRARVFATPVLGRILAELAVVPIGLRLIGPSIRSIFAPAAVSAGYSGTIGAALAIRPKSYVATCRDIVDLHGHLVRSSAAYSEIRAPVEIVTGDTDRVVAPAIHSWGLARDIPGARLTILAGAGHMPHWSRTTEVVAAIERVSEAGRYADLGGAAGRGAAIPRQSHVAM